VEERFLLLYRHSAVDGEPGGTILEDSILLAKALENKGLDVFDVSAGRGQKDSLSIPEASAPEGTHAELAGRIKAVVSIPVIAVGRIQTKAVADKILGEEKADLIALGRQLLADPFWPQKLQEGREGEVVLCTYCNSCTTEMRAGRPIACPQNPELGKEGEK
jgi:2,4-dienoyl-CoA reductase-like NADH-dependent reductase (Old Yellow Enzyme family)